MKAKSIAKINIGLQVLNKREDGFHSINSVFFPLFQLFDEMEFEKSSNISIDIEPKSISIDLESNIIYKTIIKLREFTKRDDIAAKIKLVKRIPMGAGLGGGSSNAAETLLSLNKLFNLNLSKEQLSEIALQIGSDVPFFIEKKTALVSGRGEFFNYFDYKPNFSIHLYNPKINISTKWAYEQLHRTHKEIEKVDFASILLDAATNPLLLKQKLFNDFESPVFKEYPKLAKIKEEIYKEGAVYAQMSGSGSTLFGFFHNGKSEFKLVEVE